MTALVLHLHGPMQAWGARSRFDNRSTEAAPTKSALVGLLAAALGRPRRSPVEDLAALRLTTRHDNPGQLMRDYHTVGGDYPRSKLLRNAEGKPHTNPIVTERFYLADAAFTVAFDGDDPLIHRLADALRRPRWPLALGRRSCPPSFPLVIGVIDEDPATTLAERLPVHRPRRHGTVVRFSTDDPNGDHQLVRDVPGSRLGDWRSYRGRTLREWTVEVPEDRLTTDPFDLVDRFEESTR